MKRIYKWLLIIPIGIFSACDSLLDIDPEYTQDAENFFNTPEDFNRAIIGVYDMMQPAYLNIWIGEIASDNAIAGGESVNDTRGLHEIQDMTHGGVNDELRAVMRVNYTGIARANYIFENQNKIDFPGKNLILAEARMMRAYFYFNLVNYFGDMPLIIDRRLSINEVSSTPRAPKADIYAQIEADLRASIDVLPATVTETGRLTSGAATALLGKVLLYQGKYPEAATVLGGLIDSNPGGYSLFEDFTTLFLVANQNVSEDVFTIQFSGLNGGDYGCLICLNGNAAVGFHGVRQYEGPFYADGNSYNLPTQNLYDAFDDNDIRRDATILDIEAFIASQPNPSSITYAVGGGGHTGYYQNKYIKRANELGLPDDDLTSPLNYRVIRWADVLLMAAEAFQRSGNDGRARTELNKVRQRVNMPAINASGDALYQAILRERRLELSGEGYRFWDLVRTGQAAERISGFVTGKHELFPIPQVEIDLVGGTWSQNPGY
ncbi:RagB/SusD family nutrient uptake outer membrane protein [Belliella kenyensis]|uniref:RagB/SusD family nutrient uptake outer membrane protein n=1 Tax=Belliella kenyensis TaxID=1472724 RepID=A0ABV8EJL6_9BACT|nr:RagB/SusD family nutrient uptake outer membrane protein [Belliella kenyensis]MCH7400923.1 RagB/SusD family nutrient uptake outer membrane protein [Belliella kenyensis]MDN3603922.1 RagB/SusD family nutrient uptake outer membrane protein [Belliella kenyensis]